MAFDSGTMLVYNGVTFGGDMELLSLSGKPVYDRAGRTVAHVVYSLAVRGIFTAVDSTDTTLDLLRNKLLQPAGKLFFSNVGFGDFTINVGRVKDVVWGPKPQMLSYKPIGIAAAEVVWQCDVAIPQCDDAVYENALMEFNYRLDFDIDEMGYTTRTHSGYITIPQTRGTGRRIQDSADDYWDRLQPRLPDGFRRGQRRRQLDESKCRLDFSIIDTEMGPNIPPPGVTAVQASHRVRNVAPGLVKWAGTIHAEYDVPRNIGPETCWQHFFKLVKQRVKASLDQLARNNPKLNEKPGGGTIIPVGFEFGEPEIYGHPKAEFDFHYIMIGTSLKDLLKTSSMWMPVDNSWDKWRLSLESTVLNARGNAGLRFHAQDDAIIDLCLSRRQVALQAEQPRQQPALHTVPEDLGLECPDPDNSWIHYENHLEIQNESGVIEHKPIPRPQDSNLEQIISPGLQAYPNALKNIPPSYRRVSTIKAPESSFHRRSEDQIEVFLVGQALRACYDIPPPKLEKIGTTNVVEANRSEKGEGYKTWVFGNFGVPIMAARWRIRYLVPTKNKQTVSLTAQGTPSAPREQPRLSTVYEVRLTTVPGD